MKPYVLLCIGIIGWFSLCGQYPQVDKSFAQDGYFLTSQGSLLTKVLDSEVQQDQKTILAGSIERILRYKFWLSGYGGHPDDNFFVSRSLPNGQLDPSFANKGILSFDMGSASESIQFIKLDANGNIYALGLQPDQGYLFKLTPGGILDSTFGIKGAMEIGPSGLGNDIIQTMLLDSLGNILLGGRIGNQMLIKKVHHTGVYDSLFGTNGRVTFSYRRQAAAINDIQWQFDSLILIGGFVDDRGKIIRLRPNGSLDTLFGVGGMVDVVNPFTSPTFSRLEKLWVYPDNHFITAGNSTGQYYVSSYLPNGKIDSSRYSNGHATPTFPAFTPIKEILPSEKREVFLLGKHNADIHVMRIDSFGKPDDLYGYRGLTKFKLENRTSEACSFHPINGNNLLISGHVSAQTPYFTNPAICLLDSIGNLSPTYNLSGYKIYSNTEGGTVITGLHWVNKDSLYYYGSSIFVESFGPQIVAKGYIGIVNPASMVDLINNETQIEESHYADLKVTKSEKLLITGYSSVALFGPEKMMLIQTDKKGQKDMAFGNNGIARFPEDSLSFEVITGKKICLQKDGKILIGCLIRYPGLFGYGIGVIRFHANGTPDFSFNGKGYVVHLSQEIVDFQDMILLPDEKILLLGAGYENGFLQLLTVNKEGGIDSSFGTEGIKEFSLQDSSQARVWGGSLFYDKQKILIGGSLDHDNFLLQLAKSGEIDTTFGTNGLVTSSYPSYDLYSEDMEWTANGHIYLTGWSERQMGPKTEKGLFINRFDHDGIPDSSFGQNGMFFMSSTEQDFAIYDIEGAANQDFYLAGAQDGKGLIMHFLNDLTLSAFADIFPNSLASPLLYPNPIKHSAHLRYELTSPQEIEINLLDLSGRKLTTLVSGSRPSGKQGEALLIPDYLPKGWVIIQLKTEEGTSFIKAISK